MAVLLVLVLVSCVEQPGTLFDDLGNRVTLRATPQRVVTLAPNLTQLVIAAGGQDRLVGTDDFSTDPPAVRALPKVGDIQPNIELIAGLKPDLVVGVSSANHQALARPLAGIDVPLYVVRTDRLTDIPRVITRFGEIFGTSAEASRSVTEFRQTLDGYRRSRPRKPRVLFAVWLDPLYVAGRKTFIDDLLGLTGAENAVQVDGWPQYSLESIAAAPPDLIVVATRSRGQDQLEQFFRITAPWSELDAVRSRFWYVVDEDRFARAGPRIHEAATDLVRIIDQWEQSQ